MKYFSITVLLISLSLQSVAINTFADSNDRDLELTESVHDSALKEFVGNEMVVINDLTGYVVVALCPNSTSSTAPGRIKGFGNSNRLERCEIKYFGSYEYLCHKRKRELSVFRGIKFVGGVLLGFAVPITLPLVVNIAGYAFTGYQAIDEVETQYEIWATNCSGGEAIDKEDEAFELIWRLHGLGTGGAIVFNQEGAAEYYAQFISKLSAGQSNIEQSYLAWDSEKGYIADLDYDEAKYIDPTTGANGRPRTEPGKEAIKSSGDSF